jgi:AbrB family looped-hinge helix DNA binding protein
MNKDIVTVSPKFQVVIPLSVRESLGLQPGAKMMVVSYGDVIRLLPLKPASAYRGIARGIDTRLPDEADRL